MGGLAGRPASGKTGSPEEQPLSVGRTRDAAWAGMQPANRHRLLIHSTRFAVRNKKKRSASGI